MMNFEVHYMSQIQSRSSQLKTLVEWPKVLEDANIRARQQIYSHKQHEAQCHDWRDVSIILGWCALTQL